MVSSYLVITGKYRRILLILLFLLRYGVYHGKHGITFRRLQMCGYRASPIRLPRKVAQSKDLCARNRMPTWYYSAGIFLILELGTNLPATIFYHDYRGSYRRFPSHRGSPTFFSNPVMGNLKPRWSEVIYYQCEPYWSSSVHKEAGCGWELKIAVFHP